MNDSDTLKNKCRVATQEEGDCFVGIKVNVDEVIVNFPLGFQISEKDSEIRSNILNLLSILEEFKDKQEGFIAIDNNESSNIIEFPLNAYLEVISYYMVHGYYAERDSLYKTRTNGNINWSKTVKRIMPLLQKNNCEFFSPIYTQFVVKELKANKNSELYYINRYCVYESFEKLGWIFTSYMPPKPKGFVENEKFLPVLYNKLSNTFNDSEKRLLQAMIDILEKMDATDNKIQYYYGTEHFENIWEGLIDKSFGISNKNEYYPKADWNLPIGRRNPNSSHLKPDTIMVCKNKIYVIDAKYYRYGYTKNPYHLPGSADVNKQISYAEFVQNNKDVEVENIYNLFLMPFNKNDELFNSDDIYLNIGEVTGNWKTNEFKYEHVQGILVDIKHLMENYKCSKNSKILKLAKFIDETYENNLKLRKY